LHDVVAQIPHRKLPLLMVVLLADVLMPVK
jgi:hypothetical protein